MKPVVSWAALVALICAGPVAAQPDSVLRSETATTLWDKLIDATVRQVKTSGPDADVAHFISMAREAAWARRNELVTPVTPYLRYRHPQTVAGAIAVVYGFRSYRPMGGIGDGDETPEERFRKRHAAFFARLDQNVHTGFDHFHRLNDGKAFHDLALYLGVGPSKEAKRELLRLAKD